MSALNDPDVHGPHADGTYTIEDGDLAPWMLRDTGRGWEATHPNDGFDGHLFATAEDAAQAVVGDPSNTVLFDGRRFAEVAR